MESIADLIRKVNVSEELLATARQMIAYVCQGKVSVDLSKPPDLRHLDDTALSIIVLSAEVDGEMEWNAATSCGHPPSDAVFFMETTGLKYWQGLCRRHAAVCELLTRRNG